MKKESEVDEFGRKLHEKFMDNRKSFWKEIERGGAGDVGDVSLRMKREGGIHVSSKE